MKKALDLQLLLEYIKHNWFKIGIVLFVLLLFIRKDMSFQLNLNTPEKDGLEIPTKKVVPPTQKAKKKEKSSGIITQVQPSKLSQPKAVLEELNLGQSISNTLKSFKVKNELHKVDESTKRAYLKRFAKVAVSERDKYGIPASIILANAMYHSYAGTRDMAGKEGNNHFAIPCTDDWTNSRGTYQGVCYRHFGNAWTSFRNHSQYITSGRFENLKGIGASNYKSWAKELERKGYSDFDNLADNLIKIIDEYSLYELDK